MLNSEETSNLLQKAKNGDNRAKEMLLINNSGLIKSIAKRFINKGVEYDDLYQLGCIGFIKAIDNYDFSFENKFTTYAVPMILGEIKRFLRDNGSIKVSRLIKNQAYKINRFIQEYKNNNGCDPKIEDISKSFNMSGDEISFVLDSSKMPVSLYGNIDDGDEEMPELLEKIPDSFSEDALLDKIMFSSLIEELPEREKKIIIMRYYFDKTQSETAKIIGISQVQVSRIEQKILEKFKKVI